MTVNASNDWVQELFVKEFVRPKLLPSDFYYNEMGNMVMTESYHIRRGKCCGSGCKHCPYEPLYQKGNTNLKESLRK
jgi:hypothetical protein